MVSNLITTVEDANIEKGVIVSKEGFTSGAIALAKQRNISLVEMREPNDADWEGTIKTIHIMMHMIGQPIPERDGIADSLADPRVKIPQLMARYLARLVDANKVNLSSLVAEVVADAG